MPSRISGLTLTAFFIGTSLAYAENKPATTWDAQRITSPETVDELRALEAKVKEVTEKVLPATVGLFLGNVAGSGVIVNDSGLVLTAAHVIGESGKKVRVVLADGTFVNGKSLGLNTKIDSGMLQITDPPPEGAKWSGASDGKWPFVPLGKSADLKKGQWVISLGHHGGYRRDRTAPLRLGRFEYYNEREKTLRSDCTLVGGDSGGPLFDLNGKLIGIHSKIGITLDYNHHVAIDAFQPDWNLLAKIEKPEEPLEKTPSKSGSGLTVELGATLDKKYVKPTILEVTPKSAAAKAGLEEGDIILRVNDDRVKTREELREALTEYEPGDKVTFEVQRGERTLTFKLTLAKRTDK